MANRKFYSDNPKDEFFISDEAQDLFDDFLSINRKLDSPLDAYYDFIDDLVERDLIDERLRDRIEGITGDMISVENWFKYNLK